MRKDIGKILEEDGVYFLDQERITDQICSLIAERLEKTKKEFMGLPSVYVCDIDQLIKELKGESPK